jgi:hypothetical protein
MKDNFSAYKWFRDQHLNEGDILDENLPPHYIDRMEGLAVIQDLKQLQDLLRIQTTNWMQEGFEKEDVKDYINMFIDQI